MKDVYEWANREFNECFHCNTGFTQLMEVEPYHVCNGVLDGYKNRLAIIHEFQDICIDIFKRCIINDEDLLIRHWLLNDTPISFGLAFHKELDRTFYRKPVYFRTDELSIGKICEIQCPGSLWGELQLAYEYAKRKCSVDNIVSPADSFSHQLYDYLNEVPYVDYLIDNSSAQPGVRYFIQKTRENCLPVYYCGLDKSVKKDDCNFVRSHSVYGLWAENYFKNRTLMQSNIKYDLPPYILFDQKATLALPFWEKTKMLFPDYIRDIFAYTVPLEKDGIQLPQGKISIKDFSNLPRTKRDYYLKYAGTDVSLNWGSKAVFRLNNMSADKCESFLNESISSLDSGKIWIVQKSITHDDTVRYFDTNYQINTKSLRTKYSGFYGPSSFIGLLVMHRKFNKVHGQSDTTISFAIE